MLKIRTATADDAAGMLQIYAPHVLHDAVTFETAVPSVEEFEGRINKGLQKFPWLVCENEGSIVGYAYASAHREREAYQWTCESSVYVHDKYAGKGIGSCLYGVLFRILKVQGLVNLYAGITLPNEASVKLHENCGFTAFAGYDNIGYKLGKWHKVGWWKLQLNEYAPTPSPPLLFPQLNPSFLIATFEDASKNLDGNNHR